MKTEVTKTVVTVEEIISRKIVKDNGVKRSADITVERRVSANGETIHIEKYPASCMDKFALPELQAFIDVLGGRVPRRKWFVNLSTGFYKTLCIVLVCIWLVTLLFFLYRPNLSV